MENKELKDLPDAVKNYRLLNTSEASLLLGYSKAHLANWRFYRKGPPYIKEGPPDAPGKVSYRLEDILRWQTANRIVPEDMGK